MAQNYAEKYSSVVDERFALAAQTEGILNTNYDWNGVDTVTVYSINTVALSNYTMSGTGRYGTPAEMDDTTKSYVLSQDKAFTFVIDKKNAENSQGAKDAGTALSREINEVIIPTIDKYRLAAMVTGAGNATTPAAITASNAYETFLDAENLLTDDLVPLTGRVAYVSPTFYKMIKLDDSFIKASDATQDMLAKGAIGMVDGVSLIMVPTSYLPTGVEFILCGNNALVSPVKLAEYKTHIDPPGINGTLIEGRIYYDAFVLEQKKDAICVHKNA